MKEMVKVKISYGKETKYVIAEKGTSIKLKDGTYIIAGKNPEDRVLSKKEYKKEMKVKKLSLKKSEK